MLQQPFTGATRSVRCRALAEVRHAPSQLTACRPDQRCGELKTQATIVLYDAAADRVLAEGDTVPVRWNGAPQPHGLDWAMRQRFEEGGRLRHVGAAGNPLSTAEVAAA